MDKHAIWKWLLFLGLMSWSLALVVPLDKIKLGLDLRGGASFTVQVDEEEVLKQLKDEYRDLTEAQLRSRLPQAVREAQEKALEIIRNRVDALGVAEPIIYPEQHNRIAVQIPGSSPEEQQRAAHLIKSAAFLEFSMVHEDNDNLVRNLFDRGLAPPGFRIVSMDGTRRGEYYQREAGRVEELGDDWRQSIEGFQAPPGYRFMLEERMVDGHRLYSPCFVSRRSELKGDAVRHAKVEYNAMGQPYVTMQFDARGARRFANITSDYAPGGPRNPNPEGRRYLAIIMDGKLYSAPFIKTAIFGGDAVIEGNFSMKEAQDLSIVLRAGSLPAPVQIIESRSVDPSLGRDSIQSGLRAAVFSGVVVILFMAIYYFWGGLIADFGLLSNMLLLPLGMLLASGVLGMFTGAGGAGLPVLTMPGIAGIVLTVGMAVDANVLIFERIREEQNQGKRFGAAVEAGYSKVFLTILDANVTTVLAATILFVFGTGPIRGFGVTLTAGIIVSMYTALVVTRMVLELVERSGKVQKMRMLSMFRATRINFIAWYKPALLASLVVLVASSSLVGWRAWRDHSSVLGADFTGGASMTFSFTERQDVESLRAALSEAGVRDAQIQYQREMDRPVEYLQVRTATGNGDAVKQMLLEGMPAAGFQLLSEDVIGPQIGQEMIGRALKALIYALVGMIIYISWRFEFAFAIGAIAALAHDVLICLGLYCLMGRQINMIVIAALLAIVGYSVNDTIVIFDRIREKLRMNPSGDFAQLCNLSINETLSRTVLTSLTTFLAVFMLLFFGGGAINDFAMLLFIGIIAGTYSTIYIAVPVMLLLRKRMHKKPGEPAKR
ncbi:MAG: protein translocase subunit SecD [Kiritimatiellia bacterium]|nr:protein translocase subunit SecD [Lentisphaerota bacterium]